MLGNFLKKILVIDDEKVILTVMKKMLKKDYIIDVSDDEYLGISLFNIAYEMHKKYDLVILDYNLKTLNGSKVATIIKEIDKDVKILLQTGNKTSKTFANFKSFGFQDVLEKPFDFKELKNKISQTLNF